MKATWVALLCVAVLAVSMPSLVLAQSTNGTMSGTVVDPSGALVPDVAITITNEGTGQEVTTSSNAAGAFVLPSLLPSTYTLKAGKSGFQTYIGQGIILTPSQQLNIGQIRLQVGAVGETVTVTADAPQVDTASGEVSSLISRSQFENLPIRSRDLTDVMRLLPGVQMTADSNSFGGNTGFGAFFGAVNGTRPDQQQLSVDGLMGNDLGYQGGAPGQVNMDAVREVTVLLSNFQAQYFSNGGSVIQEVTRSGTKDFHGTAYYYLRNNFFTANDYFRQQSPDPAVNSHPSLNRFHIFGATIGGPIPIKARSLKDKLFFFYSFDETRNELPGNTSPVLFTMPTAIERTGDFSQSAVKPVDPGTGAPFPNNVIPANRINKDMQKLLNLFPLPNVPSNGATNYQYFPIQKSPQHQHVARFDYNITNKDQVYGRLTHWIRDTKNYGGTVGYGASPTWAWIPASYTFMDEGAALNWTHMWTPSIVSETMVGERHTTEGAGGTDFNLLSQLGSRKGLGINLGYLFPTAAAANSLDLIPNVTAAGTSVLNAPSLGFGGRFPDGGNDENFEITHATTFILGRHNVKAGLMFNYGRDVDGGSELEQGAVDFSNNSLNSLDSGNSFANQLLGNFNSYTQANTRIYTDARRRLIDWYVQDSWKAFKNLTLIYGVRFTVSTWFYPAGPGAAFYAPDYSRAAAPRLFQPAIINGARVAYDAPTGTTLPAPYISAIVPGSGNTANGMALKDAPGVPQGFRDPPGLKAMPRIGFAWDVAGDGKTAVRGGAGTFYYTQGDGFLDGAHFANNPPAITQANLFNSNISILNGGSLPAAYAFPQTVFSFDRRTGFPIIYEYSLGLQRDVGHGTAIDVAYVGSLGRHLVTFEDINSLPFGTRFLASSKDPTTGKALVDNLLRPYPGFGTILTSIRAGSSNYNALQVQVKRRFARGYTFSAAYTFSKALDYGSDERGTFSPYLPSSYFYGPSLFDQRHILVVNFVFDIPAPKTPSRVLNALGKGWNVSGVGSISSGTPTPVTVTTSPVTDLLGGGELDTGFDRPTTAQRVNLTCNANLSHGDKTQYRFFNTSCIQMAPAGYIGNASKNVFTGSGRNNWDLTLARTFPLGAEGRQLTFQWATFNSFNHTQFNSINAAARFNSTTGAQTNALFGQALTTYPSRDMQFSLKFRF